VAFWNRNARLQELTVQLVVAYMAARPDPMAQNEYQTLIATTAQTLATVRRPGLPNEVAMNGLTPEALL
jgi:predicted transcriptional regulator